MTHDEPLPKQLPLMRFSSPTTPKETGSDLHRVCLARLRCAFRFSQPLDALFLPRPFRLCFAPVTSLGFTPSEVFPPPKPVQSFGVPVPLVVIWGSFREAPPELLCCSRTSHPLKWPIGSVNIFCLPLPETQDVRTPIFEYRSSIYADTRKHQHQPCVPLEMRPDKNRFMTQLPLLTILPLDGFRRLCRIPVVTPTSSFESVTGAAKITVQSTTWQAAPRTFRLSRPHRIPSRRLWSRQHPHAQHRRMVAA
jgi:hypothetical protein